MRASPRLLLLSLLAGLALALPVPAGADVTEAVSTFTYSSNMHPMGYSPRVVPFTGAGSGIFNSDLTFWGKRAYQGTYEGFRIIDISEPDNPVEIENFTGCVQGTTTGNQGDVVVYGNILVRSWNSPTPAGGRLCGGLLTPAGQEGLHVFDISDPTHPVAVAFVATPCGSHTATGVPDGNRLLIYSNPSSASPACRGFDIVQVPLANPAGSSYVRFEPSGDPSVGGGLDNLVTIDAPSSAAGVYGATGASFGPAPTLSGVSGDVVLVNDGSATPTLGCGPLVGFPAGAIALVDRGSPPGFTCTFALKAKNAQNAGAIGVIVVNNVAGDPINMGGDDPTVVIPTVMVSLANGTTIKAGLPATGSIRKNPSATRPCHDDGVVLGSAMKVACAGGTGFAVWSLDTAAGGSLTDPALLYSRDVAGVSIGHSAAFTWDGKVIVFGHEPGGGGEPRCQATSSVVDRSLFFYDAGTGQQLGTFVHPRPQTAFENCTWHNFNVVPTDKRYVLVAGNYQSGISVVDFTDPANAREIAFADPAPLSSSSLVVGGDWSTYWYNGRIYESDITRGLIVWNLSDAAVAGARKLDHLNPQTEETSFSLKH